MKRAVYVSVGILIFLVSCNTQSRPLKEIAFQGEAQGTYYMVKYYDEEGRNLKMQVDSLLDDFDQSLSAWVPNSILSRINRNDENVELDQYFIDNFKISQKVASETGGAFDCTVGPLIEAWGFGFREKIDLDKSMIDSIKQFVGYQKVTIKNNNLIKSDPRMEISFNAVAQGYSVDLLGKLLESYGIENYLIDVGGEIIGKGSKPNGDLWSVGIQKPTEDQFGEIEAQEVISLKDKALVTSGSYRKYYEKDGVRYSHMIDPSTGYPVTHTLLSVSVLAENCADADAYATAFMIMGLERSLKFLEQRNDLQAYFIFSEGDRKISATATKGMEDLIRK